MIGWLPWEIDTVPPDIVMSYEPEWNYNRGVINLVKKVFSGDIKDSIIDSALFGIRLKPQRVRMNHLRQAFPNALPIDCGVGGLIEHFHVPTLSSVISSYRGLVIDTWHIREKLWPGKAYPCSDERYVRTRWVPIWSG